MTQHKPKKAIYNPYKRQYATCGQCRNFIETTTLQTVDGRTIVKPSHCSFIYAIESEHYWVKADSTQAKGCLFFDPDCPF